MGRFGFIVHGLWPQTSHGSPQWCRAAPAVPREVLRRQLCRTPSPQLLARTWAKHGSCMAARPEGYFRVSNILADSLRYPDMERLSRDPGLTAGLLRRSFAAANPGRPPGGFALRLSRNGWLEEVWLCLDRRFRSVRCTGSRSGPADSAPVKIWRGL